MTAGVMSGIVTCEARPGSRAIELRRLEHLGGQLGEGRSRS